MRKPERAVRFVNAIAALRHLADHVLTPPESQGWGMIWKDRFPLLSASSAARKSCAIQRDSLTPVFARSIPADQVDVPADVEPLLRTYVEAIASHLEESMRLGWKASERNRSVCFDTNGIYSATVDNFGNIVVSTAFLPGFGTAEATRQSQAAPDDPHARNRSVSKMRGHDRDARPRIRRNGITARLTQRRTADWSWEQQLYYVVFRPAMQFIRAWQPGINRNFRPNMQDLKPALPRMSELKFERWQVLRQEVST